MAFFYFCPMNKCYTFLFIISLFLIACQSNQAQSLIKTIPTTQYAELLNKSKDVQLIDVRTEAEFAEEHLPNAININYNAPDFISKINKLNKNKKTFIYCLSGGRSGAALDIFQKNGFTEVYNMQGGILQWKGDQLPLTGAEANPAWKGMSKEEFEKLTNGDLPLLVDFNATWCAPCKKLKPIVQEIESSYQGKLNVLYIDIDQHKSLADWLQIRNIPLLMLFKQGKQVANIEGLTDKKQIIETFQLK